MRQDLWLPKREDKPDRWREKGTKWGRERKQRSMGIQNEMNVGKNSVLNRGPESYPGMDGERRRRALTTGSKALTG